MEIDFSTKIKALNVDKLTFDNTDESHLKTAKDKYTILNIEWGSVTKVPPPKNSSEIVKEELLNMQMVQEQWNPSSSLLEKADEKPARMVFDLVKEIHQDDLSDKLEIDTVLEDLNIFIMKMKMFFKRPRPYQLNDYHGVSLDYNKKIQGKGGTASTPSYPSGHTASAYFAASISSFYYPQSKGEFFLEADKVALSRIKEGVHFPSDNEYSKVLVNDVVMPAFIRSL